MATELSIVPQTVEEVDVVIPSGAAGLSAYVDLKGNIPVAIQMPGTWVAAALTFQASLDGGTTFNDLYDTDGSEISLTVAAARVVVLSTPAIFWAGGLIKVRSGTAATPVNQTADRTLKLFVRRA